MMLSRASFQSRKLSCNIQKPQKMTDYSSLNRTARSWMVQARDDLQSATANAEDGRHALACFLCHQSAEKAVTAFLYEKGAEHVWGHALADLCEDAKAFDQSIEFLKSIAVLLDKHYMGARYPLTLPGGAPVEAYDSQDSEHALEIAGDVLDGIEERLGFC